ncbi:MAG: hypothetical protein DDT26_00018 [Dehalococcoidia bacterium]|nr:hypothetical protein [Chloroflexota bacterium]
MVFARARGFRARGRAFAVRVPPCSNTHFIDWVGANMPAKPKIPAMKTRQIAAQSALGKAAKANGGERFVEVERAPLTAFVEAFCIEYVRGPVVAEAHFRAEIMTGQPLEVTGFRRVKSDNGKYWIYCDRNEVPEDPTVLRHSAGCHLLARPEVRRRVLELRAEAAKEAKVTAESIAFQVQTVFERAMTKDQLQVALNCTAAIAKLYGIESTNGEDQPAVSASVTINIRDQSGKAKARSIDA